MPHKSQPFSRISKPSKFSFTKENVNNTVIELPEITVDQEWKKKLEQENKKLRTLTPHLDFAEDFFCDHDDEGSGQQQYRIALANSKPIEYLLRDQLHSLPQWFGKIDHQNFSACLFDASWTLLHAVASQEPIFVKHVFFSHFDDKPRSKFIKDDIKFNLYGVRLIDHIKSIPDYVHRMFVVLQINNQLKKNHPEEHIVYFDLLPMSSTKVEVYGCQVIPLYNGYHFHSNWHLDLEDPFNATPAIFSAPIINADSNSLFTAWRIESHRMLRPRHELTQALDKAIENYSEFCQEHLGEQTEKQQLDQLQLLQKVYYLTRTWLDERRYISDRSFEVWAVRYWVKNKFEQLAKQFLYQHYLSEYATAEFQQLLDLYQYYQALMSELENHTAS